MKYIYSIHCWYSASCMIVYEYTVKNRSSNFLSTFSSTLILLNMFLLFFFLCFLSLYFPLSPPPPRLCVPPLHAVGLDSWIPIPGKNTPPPIPSPLLFQYFLEQPLQSSGKKLEFCIPETSYWNPRRFLGSGQPGPCHYLLPPPSPHTNWLYFADFIYTNFLQ